MLKRFAILAFVGLVAACGRVDKIYNVENADLGAPASATIEQVGQAIQRAATELGWTVTPEKPGAMTATLDVRTHKAVVRIAYDTRRFSIAYLDSVNLKYSGTEIHYRYNSWIRNLRNQIEKEAASIHPAG